MLIVGYNDRQEARAGSDDFLERAFLKRIRTVSIWLL